MPVDPQYRRPGALQLEAHHICGFSVLAATGSIDLLTAPDFISYIDAALAERPAVFIIDMSATDFLASAGLAALVYAQEKAGEDTTVAVVADGPVTSRPITVTGIDDVIALYPTLDAAVAALSASR